MPADLACRCVIQLAGWIVPRGMRTAWRDRWIRCVRSLSILILRGEYPRENSIQIAWLCSAVCGDAFSLRCGGFGPRRYIGAPGFLLAAAYSTLLILAAGTRGFAITR